MIYKAKRNPFLIAFFKRYTLWKINRHFTHIKIIGNHEEKKRPVLFIANHISWWDGFFAVYLNLKLFRRHFYFMMLEEQLLRHRFFNYTGGYSINKKAKSIIESLNYTAELLRNCKNVVLLFPQGEIQSMHQHRFKFEKGLEKILKNLSNRIHIIFIANLIDYFSEPKPSIYMYFEEYKQEDYQVKTMEKSYNLFFKRCLQRQKQIVG